MELGERGFDITVEPTPQLRGCTHISRGCVHMCRVSGLRNRHHQGEPPGLLTLHEVSGEFPWAVVREEHKDKPGNQRAIHQPDANLVEICPFPWCVE